MSTVHAVHSDHFIQRAVQTEVEWTPEVQASGIGVAVLNGVVTISGQVSTLAERVAATRAALRVRGVTTVIDDLVITSKYPVATEVEIAKQVQHALRWASNVPDNIQAEVVHHHVTLTGQVHWDFQRQAAVRAVYSVVGVHGVLDKMTLTPRPSAADTEERITNALARSAALDAANTRVKVVGSKVILTGHVRSWNEKEQAARAAWMSPNVSEVENEITVISG